MAGFEGADDRDQVRAARSCIQEPGPKCPSQAAAGLVCGPQHGRQLLVCGTGLVSEALATRRERDSAAGAVHQLLPPLALKAAQALADSLLSKTHPPPLPPQL